VQSLCQILHLISILCTIFHFQTFYFFLHFTVPTPDVSVIPFHSIDGAMVGASQEIHCAVSTVSGVEFSAVVINWMGPRGDTVANDSRVTIRQTTSTSNNYVSTLKFNYLMEGDEGVYTCDVMILKTETSDHVEITNLTGQLSFPFSFAEL